jgi:hypothetical protein
MNYKVEQLGNLPDCCFVSVVCITHPALAQSVVCEKTHRVTWIGEEQGWHSTAQPRRHHIGASLKPPPQGPYSSFDVCKRVGITYRSLDHWIREGWIEGQDPQGSGSRRRFTDKQLHRVKELKRAAKVKQMSIGALAERLKPLFEMERKARGIKDVPTQQELL